MYVVFLAVRYLVTRVVSYLAMGAIGIGVAALIVVVSIMNGFLEETERVIRGSTADITVTPLLGGPPEGVAPRQEEAVHAQPSASAAASPSAGALAGASPSARRRSSGKRITSRMVSALVSSMTTRSTPRPMPAAGGMPQRSAWT